MSANVGAAIALVLILFSAAPGHAQPQTGSLHGTVTANDGSPLPGVTVTLTGPLGSWISVTNDQGEFRFLGLAPGLYSVTTQLESYGEATLTEIRISTGRTANVEATLTQNAVDDTITVTAEAPPLDTGAHFVETELEKIPTARDPWAILQSTPGVLLDRINVGGSESGQDGQFVGPGANSDQTVWFVDGINVTDMAAAGSPPAYYDFESFEEMQVTTGGTDASMATPGVVLNIVTKRGTNEWRGTGRYFLGDSDGLDHDYGLESDPNPLGSRLADYLDYGFDLGGPIIKDRLWVWGGYGRRQNELQTLGVDTSYDRDVDLEHWNAKVNANVAPGNSATFYYSGTDRLNGGLSQNPPRAATAADQTSEPWSVKLEDTHVFSSSFYLTGLYSQTRGGFSLTPRASGQAFYRDGEFQNSFFLYDTERDQTQYKADASSFFNTGNLSHELKFGGGYRDADAADTGGFPGNIFIFQESVVPAQQPPRFPDDPIIVPLPVISSFAVLHPENVRATDLKYTSAYVQDTLSFGNLTANLGLRYDLQKGSVGESFKRFPGFSQNFPEISYNGDTGLEWNSISPRLGLTYALGAERNTLLRASYSRYAQQLMSQTINLLNPISPLSSTGAEVRRFTDANGNLSLDSNEPSTFVGYSGFAPNDPRLLTVLNTVDPNLDPYLTEELLFGVEHAVRPEFQIGGSLSYRWIGGIHDQVPLVKDGTLTRPAVSNDYVQTGTLSGTFDVPGIGSGSYDTDLFGLRSGLTGTGGVFLTNGDREQEYLGASLVFNKRLANRWMLRGNFTWSDWDWSAAPDVNPTDAVTSGDNVGPVAERVSVVAKDEIYINSNWSFNVNGMYQIAPDRPWGFNISSNVFGREGNPAPIVRTVNGGDVALTGVDEFRYNSPIVVDLQGAKTVRIGQGDVTFTVEGFNLFNDTAADQQVLNLDSPYAGRALSVVQPRVFRIGARFSFR